MNHLDITIDFETVAVTPNAAPIQLAAVAWNRHAEEANQLFMGEFHIGVELRSCVFNGYDFDQNTVNWWAKQNEEPKLQLLSEKTERVGNAIKLFFSWLTTLVKHHKAETVCLWCQGADFDIPILKNICRKENIGMPVRYERFCDARSFVLQNVMLLEPDSEELFLKEPKLTYKYLPPLPAEYGSRDQTHNAVFDCRQTTWNVWNVMALIRKRIQK